MDLHKALKSLFENRMPSDEDLLRIIDMDDPQLELELAAKADQIRQANYGKKVYLRGLIEVSNVCQNDCYYCGIRASNSNVSRYSLKPEQIMECCEVGYNLGLRTFVLQGGENSLYSDEILVKLIMEIKAKYQDAAITLSLGQRSRESYAKLKRAGADRYLLREECASKELYSKLHPSSMSFDDRLRCIRDLKELGFQTGMGFMVCPPYQTTKDLVEDIKLMLEIKPEMIGIGPFVPHHETPFGKEKAGSVDKTVRLISILRLLFPKALIPATTSLVTLSKAGRYKGLKAGANVIMPNLSPVQLRSKYELYDGKVSTGIEAAEIIDNIIREVEEAGYVVSLERGDAL